MPGSGTFTRCSGGAFSSGPMSAGRFPLFGPAVLSARGEGLLTASSDERSENGPFSAVGSASAPSRIVKTRAVARASGVNNPAIQSAPPLRQGAPGRRNQKAPRAFRPARTRKRPWAPGRPARYRTGNRWARKAPSSSGRCNTVSSAWSASSYPVSARGCPSNMATPKQRTSGAAMVSESHSGGRWQRAAVSGRAAGNPGAFCFLMRVNFIAGWHL